MVIPAVPQSPNPELRMIEPLFKSATASSAFLKSFDAPRDTVGVRGAFLSCLAGGSVASWKYLTANIGLNCAFHRDVAGLVQSIRGSELRLKFVMQAYDLRAGAVAIFRDNNAIIRVWNRREGSYIDKIYEKEINTARPVPRSETSSECHRDSSSAFYLRMIPHFGSSFDAGTLARRNCRDKSRRAEATGINVPPVLIVLHRGKK